MHMDTGIKRIDDLSMEDFSLHPVWQSTNDWPDGRGYSLVRPMPGKNSIAEGDVDMWIRISGTLADGSSIDGIARTKSLPLHYTVLMFWIAGNWRMLLFPPAPRFALQQAGPQVIASALGKSLDQVFPVVIWTHIRARATGQIMRHALRVEQSASHNYPLTAYAIEHCQTARHTANAIGTVEPAMQFAK